MLTLPYLKGSRRRSLLLLGPLQAEDERLKGSQWLVSVLPVIHHPGSQECSHGMLAEQDRIFQGS